jgi:hypothetical protein
VIRNLHPDRYRGVSVTRVDVDLTEDALRAFFLGRNAYFKTRFVVARNGVATAILAVSKAGDPEALFSPITEVTLLAGPNETALVESPETDTGVPSALAAAALELATGFGAVVVHGRYEHISFIIGAQPIPIFVREVVPPRPAKLLDQARRILAVREDLPPIELVPDVIDLADLAHDNPAPTYLLPCRGSGFDQPGAQVHFLDEHPIEADWTLLGCTRSRQIHRAFYDRDAPGPTICPLERPVSDDLVLTKCCLQDDELRTGDGWVSVPWGSSLQRVGEALEQLAAQGIRRADSIWQPV